LSGLAGGQDEPMLPGNPHLFEIIDFQSHLFERPGHISTEQTIPQSGTKRARLTPRAGMQRLCFVISHWASVIRVIPYSCEY
jgi:hypothetical protein